MTTQEENSQEIVGQIGALLDETAEIYLVLYERPIARSETRSRLESDLEALHVTVGASTLEDEIQHITGIYLFEAAHELKSLSVLLSKNQIAGSLEVVSRAVVERCGRVSWLLDHHPDVSPKERAARVALEIGVSWQHYREVIQSLYSTGSDANRQSTKRFRRIRSDIEQAFEVVKEEVRNSTGDLIPSPDIRLWTLNGVAYPDYTELATWAWFGAEEQSRKAKATYKTLCAFSHPSIAASRERQKLIDGRITFSYGISYVNKILGNACGAFDRALQSYCSYVDRNFQEVFDQLVSVHDRWPDADDDEEDS